MNKTRQFTGIQRIGYFTALGFRIFLKLWYVLFLPESSHPKAVYQPNREILSVQPTVGLWLWPREKEWPESEQWPGQV